MDLALTDLGRQKLSQGNFDVVKFAVGDDEIDYGLWIHSTGSVNQDDEILKTVITEAPVDARLALNYPCLSIANDDLQYIPTLDASSDPLTLNERDHSTSGKAIEWQQNTHSSSRQVPNDILDATFTLKMDNNTIGIQGETPTSVDSDGVAFYTVKRSTVNSVGGAKLTTSIIVKSLDSSTWDELGSGTSPNRTISTNIWIQGNLSGLSDIITVTISEAFTR